MAGRLDEARVLVVGDSEAPDEELADEHPMDRAFVGRCVRGAHQEFARWDAGHIWLECVSQKCSV